MKSRRFKQHTRLAVLFSAVILLSGCHLVGAHGSLHFGHRYGHSHYGHSHHRYHEPSYHRHYDRRARRKSRSYERHYRY